MPTSPVENHDDPLPRVSRCHFVKEYLHAFGVDIREDQCVEYPVSNRNCSIGISIFLAHHGLTKRPMRLWAPAPPSVGNTPKTSFILKHQSDRCFARPLLFDFFEKFREFFSTAPGPQYRLSHAVCPELISANHGDGEDCKSKLML